MMKMRSLASACLAACALLFGGAQSRAQAPISPSAMITEINTNLPTNATQAVTAATMRKVLGDMVNRYSFVSIDKVPNPWNLCIWGNTLNCSTIGTVNPITGDVSLATLPHVANNAGLANNPIYLTPVVRDGFAAAGDGGQATYTYSSAACSAADGGAQVAATGGGCWLAELSAIGSTNIKLWGAPTDGVNDDTAAANLGFAYLNSKGGGKLYLPGGVKVVFNGLTMPYNGLSIECPWTDSTQILPSSSSGNAIIMGSGTGAGATPVADLEVNNCTFVPKTGNVQTGGSYVIMNNVNTSRLTNTRHFGGFLPILISNSSVVNYVTTTRISGTASTSGVAVTITGGNDQYISDLVADGASGGPQPSACIHIQNSGGVWMRDIDCIAQGNGLLIDPGSGQQVDWTFGSNIAFDSGFNGLNVNPANGGQVKGLSIYGLWTSTNANWGATFTGAGSIDTVELVGHRSFNNGRDGVIITTNGNFTINGGSYCGNSATTPATDSGINVGVGMQRVSILNARIGSCVGYGATQLRGIILQPSAATNNILIAGNDLTGNVNPVFNGVTTPGGVVIFANNIGYADSAVTTINGVACAINASCTVTAGGGGAAGGDLSGTYPNPTVAKVNGVSVPAGPYAVGDVLYASGTMALSRLADVATGQVLRSGGVNTAPAWGVINLATDAGASVILGANGGTGVANTGKTITLGASLTTTGAGAPTFAFSGTGRVFTFPDAAATLAALSVAQTWTAAQSFNSGDLKLNGASSGTITLNAAAAAGANTITLPAGTTDFSATGGANQVVRQSSAGGALTVGQLAASNISGLNSVSGAISGNGSGTLSQAACSNLSDGATGCSTATGTSGATIPLLNAGNTFSALQIFSAGMGSTISAATAPTIDASNQTGITIANGGNSPIAFDNMGMVCITDTTTGHTALYLLLSGNTFLVGMDAAWTTGTSPGAGFSSLAWNSGGFTFAIYNNTGASHVYKLVNFRTH